MNPFYSDVAARALHRCEYCRAPESIFNLPFEVEHIIPVSLDGKDDIQNLALACRSCNLHKGASISGEEPRTNQATRLFNPRLDRWPNHFTINLNTGEITGRTAIGRITVKQLNMNSPVQLDARKYWMQLQLFP
jgi:hypothetical protein